MEGFRVQGIPAVHDESLPHQLTEGVVVQVAKGVPLGEQHQGVAVCGELFGCVAADYV